MLIWKINTTTAGYRDIECAWTSRRSAIEYVFNLIRDEEWSISDSSIDKSHFSLLVFNPTQNDLFTLKIEPLYLDEEPFI